MDYGFACAVGPSVSSEWANCHQLGGPPFVCSYDSYSYAPYACAPVGYYGSGYFYNGISTGPGPMGWLGL